MNRDLNRLSNEQYDVLIIGGGIYGVSTAWDAALRGLKVALIDKGDFGGRTSSNSLKTIHGGLRYLQNLDFGRMRQSIYDRTVLMHIAPHLVFPMPVVMPTFGRTIKSRPAMFAALLVNDLVGYNRNGLDDPDKHLPGGRLISKKTLKEYIPGYENDRATGGALWYDCQCSNTERLVMEYALSADEMGADLANYVECTEFLVQGQRVQGIKAEDTLYGGSFDIRAKVTVNTSGPWIDEVLRKITGRSSSERFKHSSAMNIVVKKKILNRHAAGLPAPYHYENNNGESYDGTQVLFFAPWRDYTIIGTKHLPYCGDPSSFKIKEEEITNFLSTINEAHPGADIKRHDVSFFHGGLLPMKGINPDTGEVQLDNSFRVWDHAVEYKTDGLMTVLGVKYTTHRYVAGKTVDMIFKKLGKIPPACKTGDRQLYGGRIHRFKEYLSNAERNSGIESRVISHLVHNYGSRYKDILKYSVADFELARPISGTGEVIRSEIVNSVRNEMALKLSDVVLRRTDLGSGENPGGDALNETAELMGKELGWDKSRIKREIEETNAVYVPANL